MTADAKVGLLLGLFFIVVIAFLVNGLPNFIQEENTSPPSVSIVASPGQNMVLDNSVSETAHRLYPSPHTDQRTMPPQRTASPPQETVVLASSSGQTPQIEIPDLVPERQRVVTVDTPSSVVPAAMPPKKVRTHVVKSGEMLPVIAKHYYGEEQGNRMLVIRRLYEANTTVLKSPDFVCVGQKLVIPSLEELLGASSGVVKAPSPTEGLLKNFPTFFKRADKKDTGSISEYVVREGDSLWSIARQKLGDGNRYTEIARLNKGKIKRANAVAVGVHLKIPTK